jgi:hypothetical protein
MNSFCLLSGDMICVIWDNMSMPDKRSFVQITSRVNSFLLKKLKEDEIQFNKCLIDTKYFRNVSDLCYDSILHKHTLELVYTGRKLPPSYCIRKNKILKCNDIYFRVGVTNSKDLIKQIIKYIIKKKKHRDYQQRVFNMYCGIARSGNVDSIVWCHKKLGMKLDSSLVPFVVTGGNVVIIEYLDSSGVVIDYKQVCIIALSKNIPQMFEYAISKYKYLKKSAFIRKFSEKFTTEGNIKMIVLCHRK